MNTAIPTAATATRSATTAMATSPAELDEEVLCPTEVEIGAPPLLEARRLPKLGS